MPCQATPRARPSHTGWICTGEDLVEVMRFTGIPVVCPRGALEIVLARPFAMGYEIEDFRDGDHFHLVLTPAEAADYEFASH